MPISDFFVVLNPAADRGRAERSWPEVERLLGETGARCRLARTGHRGHAAELAERAAREGWPAVVAVGGDGVVHEVANGLMRAADGGEPVPLGVVPAGSGNDFVKLLGLRPRDVAGAVGRLAAAEPRRVDVGRVKRCVAEAGGAGEWYFTNGIGLGFDAQVATHAARVRRARGAAIYAIAVARALWERSGPHVRVEVDGRVVADQPLVLATIANGACHGGSFWLAPDARLDDGLLDVLVADHRATREILALLPRVLRGTHLGQRGVAVHRGTRVLIRSREPLPLHADGELVASGVRELEVELMPGRLRVL